MHVGTWIKRSRVSLGWSQEELAQLTKVPNTTISRIENGHMEPRVPTLNRIVRAFHAAGIPGATLPWLEGEMLDRQAWIEEQIRDLEAQLGAKGRKHRSRSPNRRDLAFSSAA